jgi:hypothetical protein
MSYASAAKRHREEPVRPNLPASAVLRGVLATTAASTSGDAVLLADGASAPDRLRAELRQVMPPCKHPHATWLTISPAVELIRARLLADLRNLFRGENAKITGAPQPPREALNRWMMETLLVPAAEKQCGEPLLPALLRPTISGALRFEMMSAVPIPARYPKRVPDGLAYVRSLISASEELLGSLSRRQQPPPSALLPACERILQEARGWLKRSERQRVELPYVSTYAAELRTKLQPLFEAAVGDDMNAVCLGLSERAIAMAKELRAALEAAEAPQHADFAVSYPGKDSVLVAYKGQAASLLSLVMPLTPLFAVAHAVCRRTGRSSAPCML